MIAATTSSSLTREVIKHKLRAMLVDQASTLRNVSGSPVVTEASDFNTGLFVADSGLCVDAGAGMLLQHVESLGSIVRSISREYADNPGIFEGDQFFCNDPWRGALHQNDVAIVAPIFVDGRLMAWSGALAHQVDMGGPEPGSWCPSATSVFQEAVPLPPVKVVERGVLRKDVWNVLLAHTRLPAVIGLDLKALIAANNFLIHEFAATAARYGADTVDQVINEMLADTNSALSRRLTELPDGVFRGIVYLDHDGHENRIYRISVAITKRGRHLSFDLSDTSPQAPGHINCTAPAMVGAVAAAILQRLCWDIPWNGGIYSLFSAHAPEGSLVNCRYPAPTSAASNSSVIMVTRAAFRAINHLLMASDKYRDQVLAIGSGGSVVLNVSGTDHSGDAFGTMILDTQAGGTGATPTLDGASGASISVGASIADVENTEAFIPILYRYRRLIPDTGGAGEYRGGVTSGIGITLHGGAPVDVVMLGMGSENASGGPDGGLPGANNLSVLHQGAATTYLEARPGRFGLRSGDLLEVSWSGGGGVGDPIDREPDRVLADIAEGYVSPEWARRLYGVVLTADSKTVEHSETSSERDRIRARRLADSVWPRVAQVDAHVVGRLGILGAHLEIVRLSTDDVRTRCDCGYQFGPPSQNWKETAACRRLDSSELGPYVRIHKDLKISAYYCPRCTRQHCVESTLRGDPPVWDIQLDL